VLAVIQARVASSRFPGKILAPLCGEAIISRVVHRVWQIGWPRDTPIVVAVPNAADMVAVKWVLETSKLEGTTGVQVVSPTTERPPYDVLGRIVEVANRDKRCTWVLRVCADNPLLSPAQAEQLLEQRCYVSSDVDYIAFQDSDGTPSITRPYGTLCELVRLATLNDMDRSMSEVDVEGREHVTKRLYDGSRSACTEWLPHKPIAMRAIDTPDDLYAVTRFMEDPCSD
jgi:spore coat polysaccharide biosynthesis protein SpsF